MEGNGMLKVKDFKKIIEKLSDEWDVVLEDEDGQIYDCCADIKILDPGEKFSGLIIAKE